MTDTTYTVSGMTCGHCVTAVTEELTQVAGVSAVTIDLVPRAASAVHVISDRVLDVVDVRAAIDEAGYELVDS